MNLQDRHVKRSKSSSKGLTPKIKPINQLIPRQSLKQSSFQHLNSYKKDSHKQPKAKSINQILYKDSLKELKTYRKYPTKLQSYDLTQKQKTKHIEDIHVSSFIKFTQSINTEQQQHKQSIKPQNNFSCKFLTNLYQQINGIQYVVMKKQNFQQLKNKIQYLQKKVEKLSSQQTKINIQKYLYNSKNKGTLDDSIEVIDNLDDTDKLESHLKLFKKQLTSNHKSKNNSQQKIISTLPQFQQSFKKKQFKNKLLTLIEKKNFRHHHRNNSVNKK